MDNLYTQGYLDILVKLGYRPMRGKRPLKYRYPGSAAAAATNPAAAAAAVNPAAAAAAVNPAVAAIGGAGKLRGFGRFALPAAMIGGGALLGSRLFSDPKPPQQQYYSNVI